MAFRAARRGMVAAWIAGAALLGCRDERAGPDIARDGAKASGAATGASPAPLRQPEVVVRVGAVRGDPNLDVNAVQRSLRDAETALSSCLEGDGTTGTLVLRFPIERDGLVGDIVEGKETTLASDEARACIVHIVESMRLPGARSAGRGDVEVRLEIGPPRLSPLGGTDPTP